MRGRFNFVVAVVLFVSSAMVNADVIIHFDQGHYDVQLGEPLEVDLILDADDQMSGDQVLVDGLFAMRFRVTFDTALATVASVDDVLLPTILSQTAFGGPSVAADKLGSGIVEVDAAIQLGTNGIYMGEPGPGGQPVMRLATIRLQPLATGNFSLGAHLVSRFSGDEVFIDGNGQTIDDDIRVLDGNTLFDTATVEVVVPEPSTFVSLLLLGVLTRRKICG